MGTPCQRLRHRAVGAHHAHVALLLRHQHLAVRRKERDAPRRHQFVGDRRHCVGLTARFIRSARLAFPRRLVVGFGLDGRLSIGLPFSSWYCGAPRPGPLPLPLPAPGPGTAPGPPAGGAPAGCCAIRTAPANTKAPDKQSSVVFIGSLKMINLLLAFACESRPNPCARSVFPKMAQ